MKKTKLCFICSSGGHFSELKNLSNIAKSYNSFLVTEKVENFKSDFCEKKYFVREINRREKLFVLRFLLLAMKELWVFIKERPDYIISTGALCAYPMIKIAKLFRKKVIYIESYARVKDLSMTGKKVYKDADLFFVQWPELIEKYPKAKYVGSFFGGDTI